MKILKTLWLIPVLGLLPMMPSLAYGYSHQDSFGRRLEWQLMQIKQGERRGDLTRYETNNLLQQHWSIVRLERVYLRDGRLNHRERRILDNMLDRAEERIYRMKRNGRYSTGGHGWHGDRFAYRGHH